MCHETIKFVAGGGIGILSVVSGMIAWAIASRIREGGRKQQ